MSGADLPNALAAVGVLLCAGGIAPTPLREPLITAGCGLLTMALLWVVMRGAVLSALRDK